VFLRPTLFLHTMVFLHTLLFLSSIPTHPQGVYDHGLKVYDPPQDKLPSIYRQSALAGPPLTGRLLFLPPSAPLNDFFRRVDLERWFSSSGALPFGLIVLPPVRSTVNHLIVLRSIAECLRRGLSLYLPHLLRVHSGTRRPSMTSVTDVRVFLTSFLPSFSPRDGESPPFPRCSFFRPLFYWPLFRDDRIPTVSTSDFLLSEGPFLEPSCVFTERRLFRALRPGTPIPIRGRDPPPLSLPNTPHFRCSWLLNALGCSESL